MSDTIPFPSLIARVRRGDAQAAADLIRRYEPELRVIAVRKMEGYTNEEIAAEFQYGLRSVERKLAVIRNVWREASES